MFSVYCPRHRGSVLLGPSDIIALAPGCAGGFQIAYRCSCGHEGRWPEQTCGDGRDDHMAA
ncbi:MAG TPA: hypothetical protein VGR20_22965 [Acidimicrobiia bacterium]|nr:hypothetical protein [Acidimicrobiia bacterium]